MDNLFSVKDKIVLITGAGGGIGSALVRGFREAEADVVAFARTIPEMKFKKFIAGKTVGEFEVDLSSHFEVTHVFNQFLKDYGKIDVLVNCAGMNASSDGLKYPVDLWHKILDNNLNAVFYLSQLAGLQMIKQGVGGSIINFISINAVQAMPNNPSYAAAKSGIRQLTKSFAYDWGKYGIRVNNIGPGYTKTKMNKKSYADPKTRALRANNSMLGRWAEPEEMVGPTIFLASDASSFITAADLWVDGGKLVKGI